MVNPHSLSLSYRAHSTHAMQGGLLSFINQRVVIVCAVALCHLAGLWALQHGLLRRAIEVVVPIEVMVDVIELAQPEAAQPPAPVPTPPSTKPTPKPLASPPPTLQQPRVEPSPVLAETPSERAPVAETSPPPSPSPVVAASPATQNSVEQAAPPAPPAPPKIELPSSKADYLNNPQPPYPGLSKRLGEQGLVVVRALIETNGTASKVELKTSSGFDRLDTAALQAVQKWRYVPGKRNGEPQAMWFDVPIHFQLTPN